MDILNIFELRDKDFPVNIIGSVEEPLFRAKDIAQLLGLTNINSTLQGYDSTLKVLVETDTRGGKQKVNFLTELGLYKLLFRSNKPVASEFQKWVCSNVIKKLRLNGKYESKKQTDFDKRIFERQLELERHRTLVSSFEQKKVVYICILENHRNMNDTDLTLYKIGWTNDFKQRCYDLEKTYGPVTAIHIFECNNNIEFEKFLFKHTDIACHRYHKNIIKRKTREIFLLTPDELYNVLEIIRKNIHKYQSFNTEQLLELKRLDTLKYQTKLAIARLQNNKTSEVKNEIINANEITDINEIVNVNDYDAISVTSYCSQISDNIDIDEENYSEILPPERLEYIWKEGESLFDIMPRNNSRSPYIQKYDATTFELLETHDSIIDMTRKYENLSYSGLKEACKNNTIYKGYRWLMVDKSKPNVKYDLEPTTKIVNNEPNQMIAMLDIDKTKIVEVYPSQKHASVARKLSSRAAICLALKNGTLSSGHYWKHYDECSDELKATYTKPLPDELTKSYSKKVKVINRITNEVVKIHNCVSDVVKEFQMSRLTLKKICGNNIVYKNWLFEFVE